LASNIANVLVNYQQTEYPPLIISAATLPCKINTVYYGEP